MNTEGRVGLTSTPAYRGVDPVRNRSIADHGNVMLGPLEVRLFKVALFVSVWVGFVGSMFEMLKRTIMMIHAADMGNHPKI